MKALFLSLSALLIIALVTAIYCDRTEKAPAPTTNVIQPLDVDFDGLFTTIDTLEP